MKKLISSCAFAVGLAMGLSACTDPYDPGQRAIGGGLFGAGTGAAIGGIAGGGRGAATGALIGGALGAVSGAATTPSTSGCEIPPSPCARDGVGKFRMCRLSMNLRRLVFASSPRCSCLRDDRE